ncbi:MAG: hypothetical protein JOZ29_05915 [Deltaproteobacteria bacterium]|nr:hypothetical protein [Deltaproteobacteria bacterium]
MAHVIAWPSGSFDPAEERRLYPAEERRLMIITGTAEAHPSGAIVETYRLGMPSSDIPILPNRKVYDS